MRVLHVDTGEHLRGGQRQVLSLLKALREHGHDCLLLARDGGPLFTMAANQGFNVRAAHLRNVWSLSPGFEIVHAHDARAHTLAAIASRRRFVVSRRVHFRVGRSLASVWKYGRAGRFLAVSQHVANELKRAGVGDEKIDVIYDAVETDLSKACWDARGPVVALASLDPKKGRDLVERAVRLLPSHNKVSLLFSNDLQRDLQGAALFLYISRSEGLGSAAILAMSMGVPVIASAIGGLTEVIEDGVSGLSVTNEPMAIAAAIRRLQEEANLAASFIERGRERVRRLFTIERQRDETLLSYGRALGG